jgi:hypothetical protein
MISSSYIFYEETKDCTFIVFSSSLTVENSNEFKKKIQNLKKKLKPWHVKGSSLKPRPPTPPLKGAGNEVKSSQVVAEVSRSITSADLRSSNSRSPPTTRTLK